MNDSSALIIGVVCAGIGGEPFVRGVIGLAHRARVSPVVTTVAFGSWRRKLRR